MINWMHYPKSTKASAISVGIVGVFESVQQQIGSARNQLGSNQVLALSAPGLIQLGFRVEAGKKKADRIAVPVLFGENGRLEKAFHVDAYHEAEGYVLEVEAGRGVDNNQFLKDLFEACMMHDVRFAAIAVRNVYRKKPNYGRVKAFFDTLYASNRLQLPLHGLLLIGY
jgi:hypothetical protein